MIVTYVSITHVPEGVLKGEKKDNTITLRLLGGFIDDIAMVLIGSPSFEKDDEVLLFTRPSRKPGLDNYHIVVGLAQGKYRMERGGRPENDIAIRDLKQVELVGANKPGKLQDKLPLVDLKAAINQEVQKQEQEKNAK